MTNQTVASALAEWKYISGLTLKAVEAFPADRWDFSPGADFGSFAKQLRHVICCRGVFADGFVSGSVDFAKKHSFYSEGLSRDELVAALNQSTAKIQAVLTGLESRDLSEYKSDYYGEAMTFIEHFSAMVCHEALHRGQWSVYSSLAKKGS